MTDKTREAKLRRWAKRLGLELKKSRLRYWSVDDRGQYGLINPKTDTVVAGDKFDLSLDQVEAILEGEEKRLKGE